MILNAIQTLKITTGSIDLLALIDQTVISLAEGSVLAITSKVVSLCEGSTVPIGSIDKDELVHQESDRYLPPEYSAYSHHFTLKDNVIIAQAGIDESNGDGQYVLWPKDSQATANAVSAHLKQRHGVRDVGVIIVDSASLPLRRGASGVMLAHSGFKALNDYVGKPDLFGHPFKVSVADVAGGLAAAAVLQMGEGSEQTPIVVISDVPFVAFQNRDPSPAELAEVHITLEDDLFAPFLANAPWKLGGAPKG